jgi:hypothetical protein
MDIAIIADTHIPYREQQIPASFRRRIRAADHVIHAGDFTTSEAIAEIRDLSTALTAVKGNMEADHVDMPSKTTVELGGIRFGVTHGWLLEGYPARSREEWLQAVAGTVADRPEPRVAIGGHTHSTADTIYEGVRVLNPGTATGADPADTATMLTAVVENGDLEMTFHELD